MIQGVSYGLVPLSSNVPTAATSPAPSADTVPRTFAGGTITPLDADLDFRAHVAICGEPQVSVDWDQHSKEVNLNQMTPSPVAFSASAHSIHDAIASPFFLDTGANAHITPERSHSARSRPTSSISGVGGCH